MPRLHARVYSRMINSVRLSKESPVCNVCRRRASETYCSGLRYLPTRKEARTQRAECLVTGRGSSPHVLANTVQVCQSDSLLRAVALVTVRSSAFLSAASRSARDVNAASAKDWEPESVKSRMEWSDRVRLGEELDAVFPSALRGERDLTRIRAAPDVTLGAQLPQICRRADAQVTQFKRVLRRIVLQELRQENRERGSLGYGKQNPGRPSTVILAKTRNGTGTWRSHRAPRIQLVPHCKRNRMSDPGEGCTNQDTSHPTLGKNKEHHNRRSS